MFISSDRKCYKSYTVLSGMFIFRSNVTDQTGMEQRNVPDGLTNKSAPEHSAAVLCWQYSTEISSPSFMRTVTVIWTLEYAETE